MLRANGFSRVGGVVPNAHRSLNRNRKIIFCAKGTIIKQRTIPFIQGLNT